MSLPAVDMINGVEYVVYGFGGNPSYGFELGDAVIAFALPSAESTSRSLGDRPRLCTDRTPTDLCG
jgi:hypothetical protein